MGDRDSYRCEPITLLPLGVGELENTLRQRVKLRSSSFEKLSQRLQVLHARVAPPGQPAAPGVIRDAGSLGQIRSAEDGLIRDLPQETELIQRNQPTETIRVSTRERVAERLPAPSPERITQPKSSAQINQQMRSQTHPHLRALLGKACANVFGSLRRAGRATAAELAQELAITPNGVRRHLKRLEEAGLVDHTVERRRQGRPAHRFQLRPGAERLYPSAFPDAAIFLSEYALAEKDARERQRLAEMLVTRLLGQVGERPEPGGEAAGLADRYAALLQRLEKAGFMPSEADTGREFCLQHCLFGTLLRSFPELCEAERVYFERFLGPPVRRTLWRATEDPCCFRVEAASERNCLQP